MAFILCTCCLCGLLFDKIYLNIAFKNQSLLWVVQVKSIAVLVLSYGAN